MRKDTVVLFFADKQPRILHGVDAAEYSTATNVLINPIIPRGVPPHLWTKEGSKIGIRSSDTFELPVQTHPYVLHRPDLTHYLAVIAVTASITFIFCLHFLSH